ncbi:glycosyltransferase family 4 protein [Hymenobacter jejuensis]|uniref:Glycosyltransferase family 4 protein n=1 Tax=Hymenobacter jejuensis TaxID=2502781 RepID=A0A5B7ZYH7_9BACT|nr:glycosyltransferase family 4 protein [Hymenobacter jejuensis]QDA58882.1 glycosyltransferase family 4 protein [Hymenobacter jejuensis]
MKIGLATPIDIPALHQYLDLPEGVAQPTGLGGSAITPLVTGLLAAGHAVSIYTLDLKLRQPVVLRGPQLTIYVGHFRNKARYRCFDLFKKEADQIRDFIIQDNPEIVHAHWAYEFARGALASGWPHLVTLHDDPWLVLRYQRDLYRVFRLMLKLLVLSRGRNFTAVSPYLAKALETAKRKPIVVPNAVLQAPGGPRSFPAQPPYRIISLLTGWSERKNADTALLAFQELRRRLGSKVEYWVFGDEYGPGGQAQRWAEANAATDGVHFAGLKSHTDILNLLPDFDILLHPAREESFGMTLVEAMQAGLPVVAGETSGAVPWVLDEGRCGVLVDVNSPTAMADALYDLLTQPSRYEALSTYSSVAVSQRFSIPAVTAAYEAAYRQVLAGQPLTQTAPQVDLATSS